MLPPEPIAALIASAELKPPGVYTIKTIVHAVFGLVLKNYKNEVGVGGNSHSLLLPSLYYLLP